MKTKRITASLSCLTLLLCMLCGRTMAQSNSCLHQYDFFCGDQLFPGTTSCITAGPCLAVCFVPNSSCAPATAPDETCPTCGKGKGNSTPTAGGGGPISAATGNTSIQQTDVRLPGLGGGLKLVRTWNSKWPASQSGFKTGAFGPNWRSTFEERVFVGSDGYIRYARGDGSFWSFGVATSGWAVAAPANESATLTQDSSYWTITFLNGEQRRFDNASGNLIAIIDRNGNTTQLSYDASFRLTTITDPASRHLSFGYSGSSSYLVTSVTSDVGLSLSYSYDTQGRLIQVTNPDQSTLSFAYDSQSLITAVTDSQGKILESHTYDSAARGVTSSRANGVDAITVSYPQ